MRGIGNNGINNVKSYSGTVSTTVGGVVTALPSDAPKDIVFLVAYSTSGEYNFKPYYDIYGNLKEFSVTDRVGAAVGSATINITYFYLEKN